MWVLTYQTERRAAPWSEWMFTGSWDECVQWGLHVVGWGVATARPRVVSRATYDRERFERLFGASRRT